MPEGLPIMLALCFMLWHAYYAQNYAGIIDAGLLSALEICIFVRIYYIITKLTPPPKYRRPSVIIIWTSCMHAQLLGLSRLSIDCSIRVLFMLH